MISGNLGSLIFLTARNPQFLLFQSFTSINCIMGSVCYYPYSHGRSSSVGTTNRRSILYFKVQEQTQKGANADQLFDKIPK